MAMEIRKGIGKGKVVIIGILFMKIKENRRKGRWRDTNFHEREIEGKMKENEENRGINDKKAYEEQLLAFWQFQVELSFIL